MNIYELMKKRRSIRSYKDSPIERSLMEKIVDAGLWAPSGKNLQNWRFFILEGKKLQEYLAISQKSWLSVKENLEKRLKPSLYQFTERFFYTMGGAPVVVLAFAEINDQDNPQTQVGNVYLAIQNMVLAAESEGLGTCIMGSPLEVESDIRKFLHLENRKDWKLVCGLTLGYPAHEPPTPVRKLDDRLHWL